MTRFVFLIVLCFGLTVHASAQVSHTASEVSVVGLGLISLEPDYAVLSIAVRVQESTPVKAATEMSERIDRIVAALVIAGIHQDSIPSVHFGISATWDRERNNRVTGYSAQTNLEATTTQLDRLADFLSVALEAGATDVGRIRFRSTRAADARQDALRLAVRAAEKDAQTIADARGGELGALLEISTVPQPARSFDSSMRLDEVVVTGAATSARQIMIRASVTARWLMQ